MPPADISVQSIRTKRQLVFVRNESNINADFTGEKKQPKFQIAHKPLVESSQRSSSDWLGKKMRFVDFMLGIKDCDVSAFRLSSHANTSPEASK